MPRLHDGKWRNHNCPYLQTDPSHINQTAQLMTANIAHPIYLLPIYLLQLDKQIFQFRITTCNSNMIRQLKTAINLVLNPLCVKFQSGSYKTVILNTCKTDKW